MRIVIPFKASNPKSRLSNILNAEERRKLAELMLLDVVEVARSFGRVVVLTNASISVDAEVVRDDSDLDSAINKELLDTPVAIIMSDLPLLNHNTLRRFFSSNGDVVIAPGRKGGTNMLLVRKRGFRVSYHYGSFFKHLNFARENGFEVSVFDSFFSSVDIDDEDDLLELLLHGSGKRSCEFLKRIGFSVKFEKTPTIERRFFMQS